MKDPTQYGKIVTIKTITLKRFSSSEDEHSGEGPSLDNDMFGKKT
jgi:hypothetical protein